MAHFKRSPIMVPVDYSDASATAVRTALAIAPSPADITVLHVYDEMTLIGVGWENIIPPEAKQEEGITRMDEWLSSHGIEGVQTEVLVGDAGLEIADYAKDHSIGLVVMPSHGYHGMKRLLLGSVTERVVRYCNCPVLVLQHDDNESLLEPGQWLPRKKVLAPIDFSPSTPAGLQTAIQMVDSRTDIDAITVIPLLDHISGGMFGQGISSDQQRREERQSYLERYLAENDFDIVKAHALLGDPGTVIVEYAKEQGVDLIVIPSHGYHGVNRLVLGSVAERVLRHAECPVLVLRRHDAE
ncbi:MAG: universal stress protein [Planctomycetaceae bacterium]